MGMITAREAFGFRDAEQHRGMLVGPARRGLPRGWRAARAGYDVAAIERSAGTVDQAAAPALAYVNHGRLLADCPDGQCRGAELVLIEGNAPAPFMCGSCFNASIGHASRPVQLPPDYAAIVSLLEERPFAKTRNWVVGEPLDRLRFENELALRQGARR